MAEQEIKTGAAVDTALDAKTGDSSAQSAGVKDTSQSGGADAGAGKPAVEERLPFHQNPEAQKWLHRERKNWEREQGRRFDEMKSTHQRELDLIKTGMTRREPGEPADPNLQYQLRNLAKLIKNDPEAARELGLSDISTTREELASLRESAVKATFDSELSMVVGKYASKYGYSPEEFESNLKDFIDDDPVFSQKDYSKGAIERAAKAWLFDNQGEMAERAANLKLINEQKEKKRAGTESPSHGEKGKPKMGEKNIRDFLDRRIEEEGGIEF